MLSRDSKPKINNIIDRNKNELFTKNYLPNELFTKSAKTFRRCTKILQVCVTSLLSFGYFLKYFKSRPSHVIDRKRTQKQSETVR